MKKIMFNDKFCLTQAVLNGTKTMTRRVVPQSLLDKYDVWYEDFIYKPIGEEKYLSVEEYVLKRTAYKVGEVVAIAQRYKEVYPNADFEMIDGSFMTESAGWTNKMFVKADLLPHHIRITDVKVERLQEISDEDCIKEGVRSFESREIVIRHGLKEHYTILNTSYVFDTPREAYAKLIDKISGKGTWESNPFVWVYDFELVK